MKNIISNKKPAFRTFAVAAALVAAIAVGLAASSKISVFDIGVNAKATSSLKSVSVTYKNRQYGFLFNLPESWKGYHILADKWEGKSTVGSSVKTVETGPLIYIRNPQWTSKKPRQDIPIIIFTQKQWKSLQDENFVIGAAPVAPTELGRNSKYIFALPARYNYAYLTGYEEVDKILKGKSLHAFEIGK